MKKISLLLIGIALLVSSCGTYTGQGAYVGGSFGAILGSAIGGISGGWRGHDIGTIVGMAGGAAVGAAIGAAADEKASERVEQYRQQRNGNYGRNDDRYRSGNDRYDNDYSGFDRTNSGDDRIDFDGAGPSDGHGGYTAATPRTYDPTKGSVAPGYHVKYNELIEIRNARIIDADRDGTIRAGEECRVTFEIMNRSDKVLYDVQPTVFEVTGNKRIHISPNLHVESIPPYSGVRYTATVKADSKLKDGQAIIRVAVTQGNREITSQVKEFSVLTRRK